jgi:hypothetical protein
MESKCIENWLIKVSMVVNPFTVTHKPSAIWHAYSIVFPIGVVLKSEKRSPYDYA